MMRKIVKNCKKNGKRKFIKYLRTVKNKEKRRNKGSSKKKLYEGKKQNFRKCNRKKNE